MAEPLTWPDAAAMVGVIWALAWFCAQVVKR
jgi:hypothetical protein